MAMLVRLSPRSLLGGFVLFCVLGPLEIRAGDRVAGVPARKPRALLTTLLLHVNTWVAVDRLIDIVWPDQCPASARRNIKTYVWQLRRQLAELDTRPRIEHGTGGYRILLRPDELDSTLFERLALTGREALRSGSARTAVPRWREALELWRGTPFDGLESDVAGPESQRLIELRQGVRAELAQAQIVLGDIASGLSTLHAMTEEQPLRESAWCQLIRALDRTGARAEALSAYRRASAVLEAELGVQPGAELRGLHTALLTDRPTAESQPNAANMLPRDLTDFIGREAELARLRAAGAAESSGPVIEAIDGMAGIGKTTLAVRAARLLTPGYPDAQLFIDLHGHSSACPPVRPAAALDSLLRMLGVPGDRIPAELDQKSALWRAELAQARAVVVLDNAADSAQVRPLLPNGPRCLVLITSRCQLGGLDGVRTHTLDVLCTEESIALFAGSLGDRRARAEPEAVLAAVDLCGRLPLAIRIAAARLRHRSGWTVGDLAERLRSGHDRLAELTAGDRSVASAFELSYRLLPERQRRMFRLLGLVPGPDIDANAAAALAGCSLVEADQLLEDLVDANLVGEPVAGRYRCHDLMRAQAARLAEAEEPAPQRLAAVTRLLDHYLHALARCADLLEPGRRAGQVEVGTVPPAPPPIDTMADALSWVDAERATLTAAIAHACATDRPTHAWQLAHGLWRFLYRWDVIAEGVPLLAAPLTSARIAGDRRGEAALLTDLGALRSRSRRFTDAEADLRQAAHLHRDLGDRHSEALALANLGYLHGRLGRYVVALDLLYEAIAIATEAELRATEAMLRNDVATYLEHMDRHAESLRNAEQALAIHLDTGNAHGEAMSRQNIGRVYLHLGHADQAATQFAHAHELYLRTGDRFDAAETLNEWGQVCRALGDPAEAVRHHQDAADILLEITGRGADSPLLNELGLAYQGTGRYGSAVAAYSEALALAVSARDRHQESRARDGLAACPPAPVSEAAGR